MPFSTHHRHRRSRWRLVSKHPSLLSPATSPAFPSSFSFSLRPLTSFVLSALALCALSSNALATPDPYEGIIPANATRDETQSDGYKWSTQYFSENYSTEDEQYFGARGSQDSGVVGWIAMGSADRAERTLTAPTLNFFVRPADNVGAKDDAIALFMSASPRAASEGLGLDKQLLVTFDTDLVLDVKSFKDYTSNAKFVAEGTHAVAQGSDRDGRNTSLVKLDFNGSVIAKVDNQSARTGLRLNDASYGLHFIDSDGGTLQAQFHDAVHVTSTSSLARRTMGIDFQSERASKGERESRLAFDANATFIAESAGGYSEGGRFYVTGWGADVEPVWSATDTEKETLRSTYYTQALVSAEGTTHHYEANVKATASPAQGNLSIGLETFTENHGHTDLRLAGKTDIVASNAVGNALGLRQELKTGARVTGGFAGGLTVSSTSTEGQAYGITLVNNAAEVSLTSGVTSSKAEGKKNTYAGYFLLSNGSQSDLHYQESRWEAKSTPNRAYGVWGNLTNEAVATLDLGKSSGDVRSEQNYAYAKRIETDTRAQLTLTETESTWTVKSGGQNAYGLYLLAKGESSVRHQVDTLNWTIEGGQDKSAQALYLRPSAGSTFTWEVGEATVKARGTASSSAINLTATDATVSQRVGSLTIESDGYGIQQNAKGTSDVALTVQDAFTLTASNIGVNVTADANAKSRVTLQGKMEARHPGWLFYAQGPGATITTDLTQAQIEGYGRAVDGATLDLTLKSTASAARLRLINSHDTLPAGTINVALTDGAAWRPVALPSQINRLTLTSGGTLDLREVVLPQPEPEPDADASIAPTTRSARVRRALSAVDGGASAVASFHTDYLAGDAGRIALTVNTQTDTGQVFEIQSGSEGHHLIDVANQSSEAPTGHPILLVHSVEGLSHPETFTATFSEARPVEVGELIYYVGNASTVNSESETSGHPERSVRDDNTHNWYLYPATRVMPDPEPEVDPTPEPGPDPAPEPSLPVFTDTAKGAMGVSTANYLLALQTAETLRERLGDIHTFAPRDERVTPWAKVTGTNWRLSPNMTDHAWDLDLRHVKVGVDTSVAAGHRVGAYFGYTDFTSQRPAPADVKGRAMEGGLYWTTLFNNRVYTDLVARVGRVESEFEALDTRGEPVKAKNLHNHYVGLSLNVGRQVPVTERFVLEPMAYVGYTHFGDFTSRSNHGLRAKTDGFESLLTKMGTTAEWRSVSETGNVWTLYAKAFWEKEWLAKNVITFNDFNSYDVNLKASRFVYGVGAEGTLGKATTWHLDVERSTGSVLREDWQVNAGLRIPF